MAEGFTVEVPITVKGDRKGGRDIGKEIAGQIEKAIKSIGIGGSTTTGAGMGKSGGGTLIGGITKMAGLLGIIATVVSSLDFILKPVMGLLKAVLMLLFMPLIPILKPVMILLGIMAKTLAPVMQGITAMVDTLISKSIIPFALETAEKLGEFYQNFALFFLSLIQVFMENLPSISDILSWFAEKGQILFGIIIDALMWAGNFLVTGWDTIKDILNWITDWLSPIWTVVKDILEEVIGWLNPVWNTIKSILSSAALTILPVLSDVVTKLGNILIDLYNAINYIIGKILFGLFGGEKLSKLSVPQAQTMSVIPSDPLGISKPDPFNLFTNPSNTSSNVIINNTVTGNQITSEVDLDELARRSGQKVEMELKRRGIS